MTVVIVCLLALYLLQHLLFLLVLDVLELLRSPGRCQRGKRVEIADMRLHILRRHSTLHILRHAIAHVLWDETPVLHHSRTAQHSR